MFCKVLQDTLRPSVHGHACGGPHLAVGREPNGFLLGCLCIQDYTLVEPNLVGQQLCPHVRYPSLLQVSEVNCELQQYGRWWYVHCFNLYPLRDWWYKSNRPMYIFIIIFIEVTHSYIIDIFYGVLINIYAFYSILIEH